MHSRIASKLFAQCGPHLCVLVVDNARLTPGHARLALALLTRTAGDTEWKARADELALDEQSGTAFQVRAPSARCCTRAHTPSYHST